MIHPITFSLRLYKWLLMAYPRGHRDAYGAAMLQVFRCQCDDAWQKRKAWGLTLLWLRIVPDLLKTLAWEHLENLNGGKFRFGKMLAEARSSPAAKDVFFGVSCSVFVLIFFSCLIMTLNLPGAYKSTARVRLITDRPPFNQKVWEKKYNYDGKFQTGDSRSAIRRRYIVTPSHVLNHYELMDRENIGPQGVTIEIQGVNEDFKTFDNRIMLLNASSFNSRLEISAYSDNKLEAARIANEIADTCRTNLGEVFDYYPNWAKVEIVQRAVPGQRPARFSKPIYIFCGGFVGVLMGLAVGGVVAFFVSRLGRSQALPVVAA